MMGKDTKEAAMRPHVLVTGGSSGIGKELARQFASDGYDAILVADNQQRLSAAREELTRAAPGAEITTIVKDLTAENSPREIFQEIESRGIEIDALVNDAGVGQWGRFADTPLERDLYVIRLNIEALTALTKLFLPKMLERNRGGILNLGSIAGFQPGPLLAVYHATKAYVVSFSEALAEELKETKVTVTCLCPGPTATHFFERADMEEAWIVKHGKVMDAKAVAEAGYQAFKSGERIYIPGATNKVLTLMRRVMPKSLQAKLHKSVYQKEAPRTH